MDEVLAEMRSMRNEMKNTLSELRSEMSEIRKDLEELSSKVDGHVQLTEAQHNQLLAGNVVLNSGNQPDEEGDESASGGTDEEQQGDVNNALPGPGEIGGNIAFGIVQEQFGQRIWQGCLFVRGHRNDMVVPCVALRHPTTGRPAVVDASGWPGQIHCISDKLKQCSSVFNFINEPTAQWYVRFAPVDPDGLKISNPKLVQLVKVMIARQLVFEIDIQGMNQRGTLYLWGIPMPLRGHSLLGVYKPSHD